VSATEDQADVEKVLTRDISAFEGIVRRWQGPPVNLAYRFCGDCGRAEEMAQEASLRAYPALDGWRKDSAVFNLVLCAGREPVPFRTSQDPCQNGGAR
jgi:RNA polymerase sigma-70 factor (ECF subfamily)